MKNPFRRILRLLAVLAVLPGFPLFFQAQDKEPPYQSPLKRHNGFSSAFQDFRSGHFHGGVDFRTFQRTGLPVYAISDGHVVMLRMVRRGSGRGVYLRHHDGNTSLYFHLERFAPRLEEILERRQQKTGTRYVGNIELNPPEPVQAGQLIGWSGETGSGFPHLHLEIRDKTGAKLNPFPLVRAGFRDRNAPKLDALILRTRADGLANGRVGELRVPLEPASGNYAPSHPIVIVGGVDVISGGRDISDSGRPVAPKRVSARLDEDLVFQLVFSRFNWEDNNQLGFVYDMRESSPGNFFFNLFAQPGYTLESSGIGLSEALAASRSGSHRVVVEWEDHFANRCRGLVPVETRSKPSLRIAEVERSGNWMFVGVEAIDAPGAERVDFVLLDDTGREISTYPLDTSLSLPERLQLAEPHPARVLEVRCITRNTVYAVKRFAVASGALPEMDRVELDPWIAGDAVLIRVREPILAEESLSMRAAVADAAWQTPFSALDGLVFAMQGNEVDAVCAAPDHLLVLQFALTENGSFRSLVQETLRVVRLVPQKQARFKWNDFSARFGPLSVRAPRLMLAEQQDHPTPFPCLSSQVRLGPGHFAFLDRVDYTFTCRVPDPRQAAIFRWDSRREKWNYVPTRLDLRTHRYTTRVRASGTYVLLRDNLPPRISFSRASASGLPRITITDRGTGVDDLSVVVRVDNHLVESEYDPDRRWILFPDPPGLNPGMHRIRVECRDRARNRAVENWSWKTAATGQKNG
ncbi:MAG: M23 family metallopeptidase [Candidatus Aminicenantes bacterium]|nr:M23 family metallopeptidase [Candidatus Aminicenantes bacterium]